MRVILPILACILCAGIILATGTNESTFPAGTFNGLFLTGTNKDLFLIANKDWFMAGNAAAQWLPPVFWAGITNLGNTLGAFCLVAPLIARWPRWVATALLALPFGTFYTHLIKRLVDMPRPARTLMPGTYQIIDSPIFWYSFPSGHSVTIFALAGILVFCSKRRLVWLALPAAMLVAFSRIAVGAHWPLDLLAGAAGGWAVAAIGCSMSARWRFWENVHGQRILAGIVFFCALFFVFEDTGYPRGLWMQYLLCAMGILGSLYALWRPAALKAKDSA